MLGAVEACLIRLVKPTGSTFLGQLCNKEMPVAMVAHCKVTKA